MTERWTTPDASVTLYTGRCEDVLPTLPAGSVHCVVTSPPYYALRDYGTAKWEGGDPVCDHRVSSGGPSQLEGASQRGRSDVTRGDCPKCGARRVDHQIGLEKTPEEYLEKMVAVFREIRRVLRDDGTCWTNMGDGYCGGGGFSGEAPSTATSKSGKYGILGALKEGGIKPNGNLKPKDLLGMPWRLAFALQADGWWLRSEIIWSKPNPMPESVTDRPTKAHEQVFLLTKAARYFYDAEAVREANVREWGDNNIGPNNRINTGAMEGKVLGRKTNPHGGLSDTRPNPAGRNLRTVWTIPTQPYPGAHFATFPAALVKPCILAGTSEEGCCPECGNPWARVVERESNGGWHAKYASEANDWQPRKGGTRGKRCDGADNPARVVSTGWRPTCTHDLPPTKCTVLDPFGGSGTVAEVARECGCKAVLIELNPEYVKLCKDRLKQGSLL